MVEIERRKYPRLNFNVEVAYKKIGRQDAVQTSAHSKNIGAGGICIVFLEKMEVGDHLSLRFSLPDDNEDVLTAKGVVVWVEEYSVGGLSTSTAYDSGIEFTDISDEDKDKINKFVRLGLM